MSKHHSNGLKVDGHIGTWYSVLDECINGKHLFLLESEQFGDEAACLIVDGAGNLVMDDIYNGFDEYRERLSDVLSERPHSKDELMDMICYTCDSIERCDEVEKIIRQSADDEDIDNADFDELMRALSFVYSEISKR